MSREEDIVRVRVMDWITDTPSEQQANLAALNSFSKIRHLEIRFTGWTINQNSRLHVGINSVPAILGTMISNAVMQELTIDLECLSRNSTLTTFCGLISAESKYKSLGNLTITCSGEEDLSRRALKLLGQAFQDLCSVTNLRFTGMSPRHLEAILYHMRPDNSCMERCLSCPCLTSANFNSCKPCPRIIPQRSGNVYEAVPNPYDGNNVPSLGFPQNLEIHRTRISDQVIANLVSLVSCDSYSTTTISQLVLKDCVITTEDMEHIAYLLKGQSCLRDITLERIRLRSVPSTQIWWNHKTAATPTNQSRLHTVRIIDWQGSHRKDLEAVANIMMQNPALQTLVLQYSSPETCSMTIHALHALYLRTVTRSKVSSLRHLQVSAGPDTQAFRLQQLSILLGHPNCRLEMLTLDLGSGPYHLDILAHHLTDSSPLRYLALSGDEDMDVTTLECFVSMLEDAPHLKTLKLDFPGIEESNEEVLRIFDSNATLEEVQLDSNTSCSSKASSARMRLSYLGLRNRLNTLLLSYPHGSLGTLRELWVTLLKWYDCTSTLSNRGKELVFTSGLLFALTERPMLVSELSFLLEQNKRVRLTYSS